MKLAALGECMIELSPENDGRYALAYGGDTLNTSVYLARLGVPVDYVTALGDDPLSEAMIAFWRSEGIGTRFVQRVPGRLPGLYMIRRDATGERSFLYWRDRAPVRDLFELPGIGAVLNELAGYDWFYLSGITLSLFAPRHIDRLLALLDRLRAGGCRIAFDSNYRPQAWPDKAAARATYDAVLARTDLAFPTLDDERALFGDTDATACIARLRAAGIGEIAVKQGSSPCVVGEPNGIVEVPTQPGVVPRDTTAAGDSFNAAYLAARIAGQSPQIAARQGHRLAACVIACPGAIIPHEAMPKPEAEAPT
jgi:2-dehydro-3-deoxygluconokinase